MKKINKKIILIICLVLAGMVVLVTKIMQNDNPITASTVVTSGDFTLTAENKWNEVSKKNYAKLDWGKVDELSQEGYKLYQTEDSGTNWANKSLNYDKKIKVLNIYPNIAGSNTLKGWMDGLGLKNSEGENLIEVTPQTITAFNANPTGSLKDSNGNYIYDVLMFGSWDSNNSQDLNAQSLKAVQDYVATGRGVLFGHDTVVVRDYFGQFGLMIGLESTTRDRTWTGSEYVKLISNGYLMKYPFEMQQNQVFKIPYSHNIAAQYKDIGTVWMEYETPSGNWPNPIYDSGNLRGGWYLKTNNNLGMIQTGHNNGNSTQDEQKIIANVLYNLAQVSVDNFANDQTVTDNVPPEKPTTLMDCEGITIDAVDKGKEYQWYVEANTKSNGVKKSDIVKETITSNIAGYFYVIDDQAASSLKETIKAKKNDFGRITEEIYVQTDQGFTGIFVDPKTDDLSYDTKGKITGIDRYKDAGKYLHVVAVDRMSNISKVTTTQISEIPSKLSYEIERTKDELKLVDLKISSELNNKINEVKIQMPMNTQMKDIDALELPGDWIVTGGGIVNDYREYILKSEYSTSNMGIVSNDKIEPFLKQMRFEIISDLNQSGSIKVSFLGYPYVSIEPEPEPEPEPDPDPNPGSGGAEGGGGHVNGTASRETYTWCSRIPQKIELKAYDEAGNRLEAGDIIYDQQIRIGQTKTVEPTELPRYAFLELREETDEGEEKVRTNYKYTVSNEYQAGKLIYGYRNGTLHARQVIVNKQDEVVIPSKGYGALTSYETLESNQSKEETPLIIPSSIKNSQSFETVMFTFDSKVPIYRYEAILPMYYQLKGYVLTTDENETHLEGNASIEQPVMNFSGKTEYWLTTYIEPVLELPSLYHWEYKKNDLGSITEAEPSP